MNGTHFGAASTSPRMRLPTDTGRYLVEHYFVEHYLVNHYLVNHYRVEHYLAGHQVAVSVNRSVAE